MDTLTKGFSSYNKATQGFEEYQQIYCHKSAAAYNFVIRKDIVEMINDNLVKVHGTTKKVFT